MEAFWFDEFSADYGRPTSYARMRPTLEGGDVLVLREDLLAIGYSERTEKTTIERLAESFKAQRSADQADLRRGAFRPPARTMHLDTVFTVISRDECLVYGPMILPGGAEEADVYECDLTKREITWTTEKDLLSRSEVAEARPEADPLRRHRPDRRAARAVDGRGQRASRSRPGVILIYDRNERTADELSKAGYAVVDEADLLLGRESWTSKKGQVRRSASPPTSCRARAAARAAWRCRSCARTCRAQPVRDDQPDSVLLLRPAARGRGLRRERAPAAGGLGHDGAAARARPRGGRGNSCPILGRGYELVVVHGNGPQVGNLMIQAESGGRHGPAAVARLLRGARRQGSIGFLLELAFANELAAAPASARRSSTFVTQVQVDAATRRSASRPSRSARSSAEAKAARA